MNFGMNNLVGAVVNMVERNPKMKQSIDENPNKFEMFQALKNMDNVRGQQLADNFCRSNNMSREQMIQAATNFFGNNS